MQYKQSNDDSLGLSITARKPEAFEEFYERHAQVVYNLIVHLVQDKAIAEEILVETFWQVWQEADEFKGPSPISARLFRIAHQKSVKHLHETLQKYEKKAHPSPTNSGWLSPLKKSISAFISRRNHNSILQKLRSSTIISAK